MNADHIGQLSQLTRGERANADLVIECQTALIDVLLADKRKLVDVITTLTDLVAQSLAMSTSIVDGIHDLTDGRPATDPILVEEIQSMENYILTSGAFNSQLATERTSKLAADRTQYESQSGVILVDARERLEKRLAVVKKSLLNKPWLKTQDRNKPDAGKPAQATKPTSKTPIVTQTPTGTAYDI